MTEHRNHAYGGRRPIIGRATLAGGTVTVQEPAVKATSNILLSVQQLGTITTPHPVAVTARVPGTSFTITSAGNTDTSVIAYEIHN